MTTRIFYYIIILFLIITFLLSLYNINTINNLFNEKDQRKEIDKKNEEELKKIDNKQRLNKLFKFVLPVISLASFFVGCYFVSKLIINGEKTGKDKYSGIIFMFVIAVILLVMNITILSENSINDYIKGKKFSVLGLLMTVGVGAIVFGFLDNFGMKLGTDALDNVFLQTFLYPFSEDVRFKKYKPNIVKNFKIINEWVSGDWRKLINHLLRFKNEIKKNKKLKDLTNAINSFKGVALDIPSDILKSRDKTDDYVDNIRDKYDIIESSKSMMGNTFSDFIGALLGAGVINLFIYMTSYDGISTGDKGIDNNPFVKYLNSYMPIAEAVFIAIGCLIPVFLNVAMSRSRFNKNSKYSWIIIAIIALVVVIMMYLSVSGVKDMTYEDKKKSIVNTLNKMKNRIGLDKNEEEKELNKKINEFIKNI